MATSSSISGSAVSASVSFTNLIGRCLVALNDEGQATWDEEMIATFLNEAIRDYSNHFPRTIEYSLGMADGDKVYDLPEDFRGILAVEYPAGQDPPAYLNKREYRHPTFWVEAGCYAIVQRGDEQAASEIYFSDNPATGEMAVVHYQGIHALITDPSAVSGANTVPEEHQHLLVQFVAWRATQHLMFAEQQSPTSNSSLLMAQLAQNARRLELSYHTALQQAIYAAEGFSRSTPWITGGHFLERIY